MKTLGWLLMLVLVAITGFFVGRQQHTPTSDKASPPELKPAKVLYYRNPMGLPDTSPVPKKDSMGMDYIPVYQDEADVLADTGVVTVNSARLQTLGVKTEAAQLRPIAAVIRAVGQVAVNERLVYEVTPRFEGWVENLNVNAVGDAVSKGQILFSSYSPDLVAAQQELQIARELQQNSKHANGEAQAAAERLIQASEARLKNWQVKPGQSSGRIPFSSPATGVVLEKNILAGSRFMAGQVLFRIADLSSVWVIADVYEKDLAQLKVGAEAKITIDALAATSIKAKIDFIYPTLNTNTRTTAVRLVISNPERKLRPGMFAHVELLGGASVPRLTVPRSAVIDSGRQQTVLLALGGGKFKPQIVQTGLRDASYVEIVSGLNADDTVVTAANFMLDAESNLKAALASFTAAATPAKVEAPTRYQAMGIVKAIHLAERRISLAHDPIPALQWPAMTMDFAIQDDQGLQGLLPGDAVEFEIEAQGAGDYVITRIGKSAHHHTGH